MSTFICEKCGCIDNSALNNNYWIAMRNKGMLRRGLEIEHEFKPEFSYFEDKVCCADCCKGVTYSDNSGVISNGWHNRFEKTHWSEYGKEKLIKAAIESRGSFVNAIEYLCDNGVITKEEATIAAVKKEQRG